MDHRFLVISSANFSWSAENGNIELGALIDDARITEQLETELRNANQFFTNGSGPLDADLLQIKTLECVLEPLVIR